MEKLFIVCTFDCSFEYYEETIEKFVNDYGDGVVIDYDLNKINDHKSHSFYNVKSLKLLPNYLILHLQGSGTKKTAAKILFISLSLFNNVMNSFLRTSLNL